MSIGKIPKDSYFNYLSQEDKIRYRQKLIIKLKNDDIVNIPDPFFDMEASEWTLNPVSWPKIEMAHIISYFIKKPGLYTVEELENYRSLEGYDFAISGRVGPIGSQNVSKEDGGFVFLRAEVGHSQRLLASPLQVWILGQRLGPIVSAHCTCMAGLGEACVHIAAVVFKVELHQRCGLAMQTVTDQACKWRQTIKKVPMLPVSDMDWSSPQARLKRLTGEKQSRPRKAPRIQHRAIDSEAFLRDLRSSAPTAVLWQLTSPVQASSSTDTLISDPEFEEQSYMLKKLRNRFYLTLEPYALLEECYKNSASLHITTEEIMTVEMLTRKQNESQIWYAVREGRLTASSYGSFRPSVPLSFSTDEVDEWCSRSRTNISSSALKWGLDMESTARLAFTERIGPLHDELDVQKCGFFVSQSLPYLGASPDGVVTCKCHGKALLEIKCPYSKREQVPQMIPYLLSSGDDFRLDPESKYYAQVQGQLAVSGVDLCYFVVWTLMGLHIEVIKLDQSYWQKLSMRLHEVFVYFLMPVLLTGEKTAALALNNRKSFLCHCKKYVPGRVIRCANISCPVSFYHYACVKISQRPVEKWFCCFGCSMSGLFC